MDRSLRWLSAAVLVGAPCLLSCRGGGPAAHDAGVATAAPADAQAMTCPSRATVTVAVQNAYAFNVSFSQPSLTFTSDRGLSPGPGYDVLAQSEQLPAKRGLPAYPAVAAEPRDFCSVQYEPPTLTVACLGPDGDVETRQLHVDPACVSIANDVGTRDLEPLSRTWKQRVAGCADAGASVKLQVVLEISDAKPDPSCPPPECRPVRVRLVVPGLRFSRELGVLRCVAGTHYASHIANPRGIEYVSDDEFADAARAYQVGRALLYVVDDAGLQSLELPCGASADFQVRSSFPIRWHESSP